MRERMMRLKLKFQAMVVLAAFICTANCQAGIVVSIDRETALAGQTVFLGVYASSEDGDNISGFNLPFDYNSDGFVDAQNDGFGDLPTGFSLAKNPLSFMLYGNNTGLDRPFPQVSIMIKLKT